MTDTRPRHTARVDFAALTERCRQRLAELDLPDPFDVPKLCTAVAQRRGRPLTVLALPLPAEGPYGLGIALRDRDYIVYEATTSPLHQEHIIVHELSHLLLGHHGAGASLSAEHAGRLFPGLDPAMVQRVLGRTGYSSEQEREAELLASMIMQRAERNRGRAAVDPAVAEKLKRLEAGM